MNILRTRGAECCLLGVPFTCVSASVEVKEQPKQEEIKAEQKLFTQEQLDNIIQARIMSERKKYEKK